VQGAEIQGTVRCIQQPYTEAQAEDIDGIVILQPVGGAVQSPSDLVLRLGERIHNESWWVGHG
jgi:hypothetical protein